MKSFFRLVLLGLVLLVVALVSALTAMRFAIHGREVTVPDVVGKSPPEAAKIAGESGIQLVVERQFFSATVAEGKILSQVPEAGALVRRGWQLRVAESLGPQRVDIPDVTGQSQRAAEINIRRRGLDIASIAQVAMPGTVAGEVLSQSPPPNASQVAAPKISLLVSDTPPPQALVMPSFIGQPLHSVTLALQDAGLRLGSVTEANPASDLQVLVTPNPLNAVSMTGVVLSQNPTPGQKVVAGTVVNLQVK
ncbi:MAG TPA: PASTA domain-containing protein [Terriglobales bacterium]|nr:PASTA domain-containing protein [Terriglobales bacterium]